MSEVYSRYIFDFLRNYQVVFKVVLSLCISTNNVCKFELYLHQLSLVSLFNFNHFRNCVMISHCGLNCIFLIANNDEHLLMYLLASCMSSLEKCLIPLSIFKLAFVLLMSCMHFVYILDANYLLDKYFANIFYHSEGSFTF